MDFVKPKKGYTNILITAQELAPPENTLLFKFPLPTYKLPGVFYFKTLEDAIDLAGNMAFVEHVYII